jgi:hypothetical protein
MRGRRSCEPDGMAWPGVPEMVVELLMRHRDELDAME